MRISDWSSDVCSSDLDRSLSKEQILFEYLSIVYFGEGAYGIGAAADVYFGKPVNILNASEAATLAAPIPAPTRPNPRTDIATAALRRTSLLPAMPHARFHTPAQPRGAVSSPRRAPPVRPAHPRGPPGAPTP